MIQPLLNDAKTRGNAEDALEDIRQFATKNNDPPPKSEDAKHRAESMWKRNMNREEVAELIERFLEERSLFPRNGTTVWKRLKKTARSTSTGEHAMKSALL